MRKTFFVTSGLTVILIVMACAVAYDNSNVEIKKCEEKVIIRENVMLGRPVLKNLEAKPDRIIKIKGEERKAGDVAEEIKSTIKRKQK